MAERLKTLIREWTSAWASSLAYWAWPAEMLDSRESRTQAGVRVTGPSQHAPAHTCVTQRRQQHDPVAVLTYAESGATLLHTILATHPELACIPDARLVQLCDRAADSWRQLDQSEPGTLSSLALKAIKSMINTITTAHLARLGKRRWCDTAVGSARAIDTFLLLYPEALLISLHRNCMDMVYSALQACPWGLTGHGFASFAAVSAGNNVAALANYWTTHTEAILAVEETYAGRIIRIRYEDLAISTGKTTSEIFSFLGLGEIPPPASLDCRAVIDAMRDSPDDQRAAGTSEDSAAVGCGAKVPTSVLPRLLFDRVNDLHAKLAYPALPLRAGN